jgi:hypothetical protein
MSLETKNNFQKSVAISLNFNLKKGFLLTCPFNFNENPKKERFSFSKESKSWQTWSFSKAKKFIQYANKKTKSFLNFYGDNLWDKEEIKKIRKAITILKVNCDFAIDKDHQGFSQSDRTLGWALASKNRWNEQELTQAAYLAYIHRRQWAILKKKRKKRNVSASDC